MPFSLFLDFHPLLLIFHDFFRTPLNFWPARTPLSGFFPASWGGGAVSIYARRSIRLDMDWLVPNLIYRFILICIYHLLIVDSMMLFPE